MDKKFEKIYEIAEREGGKQIVTTLIMKRSFVYRLKSILLLDKTSMFQYLCQMKTTKTFFTTM
mgnify:CR=1 FL=1